MTPTIISHHRLLCGDLTDVAALRALMGEERADVIYTDPPWGPRMVRFFGAMTSKAYVTPGDESCPEWTSFLDAFALVCATYRTPTAPVFVEMGLRWTNDLDAAMARAGLPLLQRWRTTYGSAKKPTEASLGLYGAEPPNAVEMPSPPHGEAMTKAVLSAVVRPGVVVLDPCTGLGMTARVTHRLGGTFRGLELVPMRLASTEAWLVNAAKKSKRA